MRSDNFCNKAVRPETYVLYTHARNLYFEVPELPELPRGWFVGTSGFHKTGKFAGMASLNRKKISEYGNPVETLHGGGTNEGSHIVRYTSLLPVNMRIRALWTCSVFHANVHRTKCAHGMKWMAMARPIHHPSRQTPEYGRHICTTNLLPTLSWGCSESGLARMHSTCCMPSTSGCRVAQLIRNDPVCPPAVS